MEVSQHLEVAPPPAEALLHPDDEKVYRGAHLAMEVSQRPSERLEVAPPPAEALLHPDDEPSPRFRTLTGFNQ